MFTVVGSGTYDPATDTLNMTITPMIRLSRAAATLIEHDELDYHDIARVRFAKWLRDNGELSDWTWVPSGHTSTPTADAVAAWLNEGIEG